MYGGRIGFRVAGRWEGVRCIIEKKLFFDHLFFCMLPFNVASHLCCLCGGRFCLFSSPNRSRTSQREQTLFQDQGCVWWNVELFGFCGSFRDLAHESCIEGANHARGGVLKSTLVVDNDSVHTDTSCFQSHSPDHLI